MQVVRIALLPKISHAGDDVFHKLLLLEVQSVHVELLLLEQQPGHHTRRGLAPHSRKYSAIFMWTQDRLHGLALHLPHDF